MGICLGIPMCYSLFCAYRMTPQWKKTSKPYLDFVFTAPSPQQSHLPFITIPDLSSNHHHQPSPPLHTSPNLLPSANPLLLLPQPHPTLINQLLTPLLHNRRPNLLIRHILRFLRSGPKHFEVRNRRWRHFGPFGGLRLLCRGSVGWVAFGLAGLLDGGLEVRHGVGFVDVDGDGGGDLWSCRRYVGSRLL